MALIPWLQSIGVTHGWTLSNSGTSTADDFGDSPDPTNITGGTYSFVNVPLYVGATHCVRSTTSTNESVDGAIFDNRNDINGSNGGGNDSSSFNYVNNTKQILFWCRQLELFNVTCMYEQGGGVNNYAFMGGPRVTFQTADAGEPFLISPDEILSQKNRAILQGGIWEHHSRHSGSGNRTWKTANGVIQHMDEQGGTANMPGHSGDICFLNSADNLKTFNENTLTSETVAKEGGLLLMLNNKPSIGTPAIGSFLPEHRELFERTTEPEVLIAEDTVANQQAALDALSGNVYQNVNCAIEIRQATDATNYTLTLNNLQFVESVALRDIAVQYVGPNTLTLINAGGSNAVEVSTPDEKDLDFGFTIVPGGGTINLVSTGQLTITGLVVGSAVSVFDDEDPDPQALGTLLDSSASLPGTSFTFNHTKSGDDIIVQMIEPGYEEINLNVNLIAGAQVVAVEPTIEVNI